MKATFICSCLVVLMPAMFLCPGSAQTLASAKSLIAGEVTNASTGNPVQGARVALLLSQAVRVTKTNSAGRFRISGVQPGTYLLKVSRAGFLEYGAGSNQSAMPVTLTAGQTIEDIRIKLSPQAVISGVIVQDDGDPFRGALVSATPVDSIQGTTYAYTNDLGEYRLFGLASGRYYVHASHRGARGSVYYPHAVELTDAVPVEVGSGSVLTGIDLTAPPLMAEAVMRSSSSTAEQQASAGETVEGRVINPITGGPAPRARISLEKSADDHDDSQRKFDTIADASGYFRLQNIQPGAYRLSASRQGFVAARHDMHDLEESTADVVVGAEQPVKDVILELAPTGVITGKAVDEDGQPLPNAILMAIGSSFVRGHREFFVIRRTYTNDLGEYRLYDLPPGLYYVSALSHARREQEDSANHDYPPMYYPEVTRLADASPLPVRLGSIVGGINFTLSTLTQVHVKGRVLLPSPELSKNIKSNSPVRVSLIPADLALAGRYSRRGADASLGTGEFELRGVAPGAYILAAEWADEGTQYSAARTINVAKTGVDGVVLRLHPPLMIRGQVRLETKDNFDFSGLRVSLQTTGEESFAYSGDGGVSQDGSFTIENLRQGQYSVSLSGVNASYYLKAVYYRGKNVTESGIDLVQDDTNSIELVLSPNGGGIEGTVVGGNRESGSASAAIVLLPESGMGVGRELYRTTSTDATGKFSLKGLAPGRYTIIAADDRDSAQELIALEHLGEPVTIEENRTEQIEINVVVGQRENW